MTQPPDPHDATPDDLEVDCADFPKLTAEEWAAIRELSPQDDEDGDG